MTRRYNKNVENSEELEELLDRHDVGWTEDLSGKRETLHRGSWLTWRRGEFGKTESSYISNTLRFWGFLVFLLSLAGTLLYIWAQAQ